MADETYYFAFGPATERLLVLAIGVRQHETLDDCEAEGVCERGLHNGSNRRVPRITHILDNLDIGGAQRMLIRFLKNSNPEESGVISMSRRETEWENEVAASPIPIQFLPSSRILSLKTWLSARRALKSSPSKIVHVHMQYSGIVFLPLAKLAGRRTVVTLHNVSDSVENWRQSTRFLLHRMVIRRFADKVISVGPLVTAAWSKFLPQHDIVTIENTVPIPERPSPQTRAEVRENIGGVHDECIVVIAVASLLPKKDLATLIWSFAKVAGKRDHVRLWIVGTGKLRDALQKQIEDLGLSEKARLLGARTDVQDLLRASDIFALSSKIEGLPISMLEAMATELPVVVPDVGDIRTVVGQTCGIVVAPGNVDALADGLSQLVDDPERRRALGRAGRRKVEQDHSEARWLEQMRSIYKALADTD